jgi:hypothetical protein
VRPREGLLELLELVAGECGPVAALLPLGGELVGLRVAAVAVVRARGPRLDAGVRRDLLGDSHHVRVPLGRNRFCKRINVRFSFVSLALTSLKSWTCN